MDGGSMSKSVGVREGNVKLVNLADVNWSPPVY